MISRNRRRLHFQSDEGCVAAAGLISLWLPRWCRSIARLRCALPLHFAAPPTPEQADSAFSILLGFSSGRTQNPPVLLPPERVCSIREHPLSSVSGRQRYNTLDLASKIVCHETAGFIGFFLPRRVLPSIGCLPPRQRCRLWKPLPRERCPLWIPQPIGRSRPYWKPRAKGIAIPLESQFVLKGMPTMGKWFVGIHSKTKNPQSFIQQGNEVLEILNPYGWI